MKSNLINSSSTSLNYLLCPAERSRLGNKKINAKCERE